MLYIRAKNYILLFLCIIMLPKIAIPMPPQELRVEAAPSYMIACLVSFCIGAAVWALVQKYCNPAPTNQPTQESPTDNLSTKLQQHKDQMIALLQTSITQSLNETNSCVYIVKDHAERIFAFQLLSCALLLSMQQSLEHNKQAHHKIDTLLQCIPAQKTTLTQFPLHTAAALYWHSKYKEQILLRNQKSSSTNCLICSGQTVSPMSR